VSLRTLIRCSLIGGVLWAGCLASNPVLAQEAMNRKVKTQVAPIYPELARRMGITGVVKIEVRVDKSGNVKDAKLVGGHPLLANAALEAIKKWKYEPASEESVGIVEFRFSPNQ